MSEQSLEAAVARFNAAMRSLDGAVAAAAPGDDAARLAEERDEARDALKRESALRKQAVARLDEAIGALKSALKQ